MWCGKQVAGRNEMKKLVFSQEEANQILAFIMEHANKIPEVSEYEQMKIYQVCFSFTPSISFPLFFSLSYLPSLPLSRSALTTFA